MLPIAHRAGPLPRRRQDRRHLRLPALPGRVGHLPVLQAGDGPLVYYSFTSSSDPPVTDLNPYLKFSSHLLHRRTRVASRLVEVALVKVGTEGEAGLPKIKNKK